MQNQVTEPILGWQDNCHATSKRDNQESLIVVQLFDLYDHRVTLRKNRCARKKLLNYYFASYSRAEIETERNMEGERER